MTDPTDHPTFTLRFGDLQTGTGRKRWQLDSTAPDWILRNSGYGNVNSPDHLHWAQDWAAAEVAGRTSYEVTGWIQSDGEAWIARLVHVTHRFRVMDIQNDVCDYTAENHSDAVAVQERFLHGSGFVRLRSTNGDETYVNTRYVTVAAYGTIRVEVPL